jgi:isoleucyl-tRNA synthetase
VSKLGVATPRVSQIWVDCFKFMCSRPVHRHVFKLSRSRHFSTCRVFQSLKDASADPKAYSKTLLLPKTSFSLWVDSAKSESLFKKKTCEELYRWQVRYSNSFIFLVKCNSIQAQNSHRPLFVLLDGPPYANGHLHMGTHGAIYEYLQY